MNAPLEPASIADLGDAVRSTPRLIPVGAGTKPRLSSVEGVRLSTTKLSGIIEYEPDEFTFTALAGTRIREIDAALAECGQYLPFDPMLAAAGATLGGTVASGVSGPGRFRFGGLRDFILGVRFVDGAGRLLRLGGKVVKNAAGFDLPKFLVGSLGRLGVLAEITFKVFPRRATQLTLRLEAQSLATAMAILREASRGRWEVDALDCPPHSRGVCVRLAGPEVALEPLAHEILGRWPGEILGTAAAEALWHDLEEFRWTHAEGTLLKIPLSLDSVAPLEQSLAGGNDVRIHISAGGNVAYVSLPPGTPIAALADQLQVLGLRALTLRGNGPLWWNAGPQTTIAATVKSVLDPELRFPPLQD